MRRLFRAGWITAAALAAAAARAEDARTLIVRGTQALKAKAYADAEQAFTRAEPLARTPEGRAQAAVGAGTACLKQRRYADAAAGFERAVAASPAAKGAWKLLGVCRLRLYEDGLSGTAMLSSALEALERAAALDPAAAGDELALAKADAAREAAWASAAAARAGAPRAPAAQGTYAAYRAAGEQAERENDPELALADYVKAETAAVANKARAAAAANLQGLVALALRRPSDARACFQRATDLNPASKYGWNNLGVALLKVYDANGGGRELAEAAEAAFVRVAALDAAYKPENLAWARGLLTELGPAPVAATAMAASGTAVIPSATPAR